MTTNRMGLEQTLSDERLEDLAKGQYFFARGAYEEAQAMARELLAYRKASRKPVADVVAWNKPGEERKCDIRWRRFDVAPGPLFAVPPLQAVTVPDGWIKCSEKMPEEEEQYYLTYSDGDGVCRSYFFDGYFADQHITHWMPLVLPPASVTNEP